MRDENVAPAAVPTKVPPAASARAPLARAYPGEDPFALMQDRMDRMFRDFFREGWITPTAPAAVWKEWPRVDVSCDAESVRVAAEIPGVAEKDVKVEIDQGRLVLTGEKNDEKEEKGRNWTRRERSFGSFERVILLPDDVVTDKAEASFSKGVLTVVVPRKVDEKNKPRAIPVKSS
ncbi:MAG: Hsp20/alpha crystallin family protein [Planctomycetes bacterium]|nr:Hsp20/alpha crystallin family protein [Planctomycetota bacterium]